MVKIIDGEIYQDNDPRLQAILQRQQQPRAAAPSGPGRPPQRAHAAAPPATGFNFSAPPFRIVGPLPGQQPLLGIPDIEVFALRLTPIVILGLGLLLLAFGWRGLLAGGILFYIWQASTPPAPPGGGPAPQGASGSGTNGGGSGGNILQQLQASLQQQFGGSSQQQQQLGQHRAGPSQPRGGPSSSGDGGGGSASRFQGRGHKLGLS